MSLKYTCSYSIVGLNRLWICSCAFKIKCTMDEYAWGWNKSGTKSWKVM